MKDSHKMALDSRENFDRYMQYTTCILYSEIIIPLPFTSNYMARNIIQLIDRFGTHHPTLNVESDSYVRTRGPFSKKKNVGSTVFQNVLHERVYYNITLSY